MYRYDRRVVGRYGPGYPLAWVGYLYRNDLLEAAPSVVKQSMIIDVTKTGYDCCTYRAVLF